jgi:hypothetical protein
MSARTVYAEKRARDTRAAEPMAKPLPMAAVVLPAASSASVRSRTCSPAANVTGQALDTSGAKLGSLTELAHLGDATSVVADGAVAVDGEADGEGGEHAEGGHSDTVLGSELEGDADGNGEGEDGDDGGLHAERETCVASEHVQG